MSESRNQDARIAAFFETRQPDLSDRALDAVRRDIQRTRQLVVIGPFREPASVLDARYGIAAALVLAVGILFVGLRPGGGPAGVATAPPSPSAEASVTAAPSFPVSTLPTSPTTFTSPLYGYTVTVPAGWLPAPALLQWDGKRAPGPDADADRFDGPALLSATAYAGPFTGSLDAFVVDRIAANVRDHSDTCPVLAPEVNEPLEIGSQSWVLLGWNCGAFINVAVTVRSGVAYVFSFRDLGIKSATDPADRALFLSILDSVELPN